MARGNSMIWGYLAIVTFLAFLAGGTIGALIKRRQPKPPPMRHRMETVATLAMTPRKPGAYEIVDLATGAMIARGELNPVKVNAALDPLYQEIHAFLNDGIDDAQRNYP